MWIPEHTQPKDKDVRLAVITAAQALGAANGAKPILRQLYLTIKNKFDAENSGKTLPRSVMVSTSRSEGSGYDITPVEAYFATKFLSEEKCDELTDCGLTGYTKYLYCRELDLTRLHQYLSDELS